MTEITRPRDFVNVGVAFFAEHGYVLENCINVYVERFEEEAQRLQEHYDAIKDDPEECAKQDTTYITTHGVKQMAVVFREAAERAQRALDAMQPLRDYEEAE